MHELIKIAKAEGCKGAIIDNDNTICYGNSAKGIGYSFWERELKRGHINNVIDGFYGFMKIKMSSARNGGEEDARNLKLLCQSLGKSGCADVKSAYEFAENHRKKREIEGVPNFVRDLNSEIGPVYLSTQGLSVSADVAMKAYDLSGSVSNPIVCSDGETTMIANPFVYKQRDNMPPHECIIVGCVDVMKNSKEKKEKTAEFLEPVSLDIGDMLCIGDNHKIDSDTMEASRLSASSPPADEETQKIAKYKIKSYVS
jgi:hypothetical protein